MREKRNDAHAPSRILIVEDDPHIIRILTTYLEREGYIVKTCGSGPESLRLADEFRPDLILLDLMLPGLDGFSVCRRLRATSDVPIIMVTARAAEEDILDGLAVGADDYVTKPFSPRQVVARIQALLRRARRYAASERAGPALQVGALQVDPVTRQVTVDENAVSLTETEFRLLHRFARYPDRVFSREELLESMYPNGEAHVVDRTIDVHIANLRSKLGDSPDAPRFIQTVWGAGYRLLGTADRADERPPS